FTLTRAKNSHKNQSRRPRPAGTFRGKRGREGRREAPRQFFTMKRSSNGHIVLLSLVATVQAIFCADSLARAWFEPCNLPRTGGTTELKCQNLLKPQLFGTIE